MCGRSIGSGPATYLAANRSPGALILISPFKSIQCTAEVILGMMKFIVADRFKNIEEITKVTCPLLLIHGQKDDLIPYNHSIELSQKTAGPYELILPEEMDHNEFNLYEDFSEPIYAFLKRFNLLSGSKGRKSFNIDIFQNLNASNNNVNNNIDYENEKIEFKKDLFETPEYILTNDFTKSGDVISKMLRKMLNIDQKN